MLEQFTTWLVNLVKAFFGALWGFVVDAAIEIVDLFLGAITGLLALIPVPAFLSGGLGSLFGQLDSGVLWIVTQVGVVEALAMFGAAYLFRMGRKVATLFQW